MQDFCRSLHGGQSALQVIHDHEHPGRAWPWLEVKMSWSAFLIDIIVFTCFSLRQISQNSFCPFNLFWVIAFYLLPQADLKRSHRLFWSINILIIHFCPWQWAPWGKSSRKQLFVPLQNTNLQMMCCAIWNVCFVLNVNSSFVPATIQKSSASPLPGLHLVSKG
jgi:hypothetical protein